MSAHFQRMSFEYVGARLVLLLEKNIYSACGLSNKRIKKGKQNS